MFEKGAYSEREGRFWEGLTYMFERGYILGRKVEIQGSEDTSHNHERGGGRSQDGGVDLIMIHNLIWTRLLICIQSSIHVGGGIIWEGGVDHRSVAHSCEKRGRVDPRSVALYKRPVYSGREEWIPGLS